MVLMSLTWFVRLGIELGVLVITLRYYSWWFNLLTSRVRLAILLLILIIRLAFKVDGVNYNQGLTKLIASCIISIALGFLSVVISVFFDSDNENSRDALSKLMTRNGLSRSIYGAVAQVQEGWTHTAMMLEGWRVLRVNGKPDTLIYGNQLVDLAGRADYTVLTTLTPELLKDIDDASEGMVAPTSKLIPAIEKAVDAISAVEPTR